jgi:hypothetical protein
MLIFMSGGGEKSRGLLIFMRSCDRMTDTVLSRFTHKVSHISTYIKKYVQLPYDFVSSQADLCH